MKYLIFVLLISSYTHVDAHGGKKHKKDSISIMHDTTNHAMHHSISVDDVHHHDDGMLIDNSNMTAHLSDFPTLHPLIVHFAIALIIVAAILQIINFFMLRKEFSWVITGLLVIGFTSAYMASTKFHPHTEGMSVHANQVLEMHDQYADWTLYLSGLGMALQILNLLYFKTQRWALGVIAITLIAAGYCVAHAAHYGAQLVHLEGVGPQGKYLELEHHH